MSMPDRHYDGPPLGMAAHLQDVMTGLRPRLVAADLVTRDGAKAVGLQTNALAPVNEELGRRSLLGEVVTLSGPEVTDTVVTVNPITGDIGLQHEPVQKEAIMLPEVHGRFEGFKPGLQVGVTLAQDEEPVHYFMPRPRLASTVQPFDLAIGAGVAFASGPFDNTRVEFWADKAVTDSRNPLLNLYALSDSEVTAAADEIYNRHQGAERLKAENVAMTGLQIIALLRRVRESESDYLPVLKANFADLLQSILYVRPLVAHNVTTNHVAVETASRGNFEIVGGENRFAGQQITGVSYMPAAEFANGNWRADDPTPLNPSFVVTQRLGDDKGPTVRHIHLPLSAASEYSLALY